jgi:polyisoprenyl-phosphate glycosyltransferase
MVAELDNREFTVPVDRPLVTIVAPVYNEESVIPEFYRRIKRMMKSDPTVEWRILFVNDGSSDGSLDALRGIAAADPSVAVLALSRNFGHQVAITAGIDAAEGDAVVVIDSDLQDPPEVIPRLVAEWRAGHKVVYGRRTFRAGESGLKLATAKAFYRLINKLSDIKLPLDTGDFRLMDKQVVDVLKSIREENRYLRGLVTWVGFDQIAVPYERDCRYAGATKYTLRKMLRLAGNGITAFSERPLLVATYVGSLITLVTFAIGCWIIVGKLLEPRNTVPGYTSVMAAVLFIGGLQLLSIGILGGYVGRTYRESKRRPLYVVAERLAARDDAARSWSPQAPVPASARGRLNERSRV